MINGIVPLEVHGELNELFMPAWGYGVLAFAILILLLLGTHNISKRRPHS